MVQYANVTLTGQGSQTLVISLDSLLGWPAGPARAREVEQLTSLVHWRQDHLNGTFVTAAALGSLLATSIFLMKKGCRGHARHWTSSLVDLVKRTILRASERAKRICGNPDDFNLETDLEQVPPVAVDCEKPSGHDRARRLFSRLGHATWSRHSGLILPIRLFCVPEMLIGSLIFSLLSILSLLQFRPAFFPLCLSRTLTSIAAEQIIAVDILIIVLWTLFMQRVSILEQKMMPVLVLLRIVLQILTPIFRPAVLVPIAGEDNLYHCLRVSIWQFGVAQITFDGTIVIYAMLRHVQILIFRSDRPQYRQSWMHFAQYLSALAWFISAIPENAGLSGRQEYHAVHAVTTATVLYIFVKGHESRLADCGM